MKFSVFISQFVSGLHTAERFRTCCAHRSTLNSLITFCGGHIPTLKEVYSKDFLQRYEKFLIQSNRKGNTISFYMTVLRSIYGIAVEKAYLPYTHKLFYGVFTGNDPTQKRALTPEQIAQIYIADLSADSRLQRCRDWFILSFLLQGMSFCDLAHLRKSDLQANVISYRRQKTQTQINVPILPEAREILERYMPETGDSPYLLPLISLTGEEGYKQYQTTIHRQNRHLKELSAFIGLEEVLTSYVPRHSWATIAYHNGVNISVVSQAMGHHTEEITRIYLDSFKYQEIYEANQTVFSVILNHISDVKSNNPEEKAYHSLPAEIKEENSEKKAEAPRKRLHTTTPPQRKHIHKLPLWRQPAASKKNKPYIQLKRKQT